MTEERLRQIVSDAYEKGETGLLIWKNPDERSKRGENEEKIFVENAFELHGYTADGKAYGEYRTMELTRALRNYFEMGCQFRLMTESGENIAAMGFKLENLLSMEGHFKFAYRSLFFKHLNGPIVLFPSCQVVVE